ncbi:LPXTG-motif cell wall-anchored protein, partial [Streptococcus rupicaprae]
AGNELAPAVTQTVTYTRTVTTNDVTGEQTFGEWATTNKELPAVTSPEVAQHTTDRQVVEALTTTADTADIEEVVVYKKQVQVIDQPDQPTRPNLPSQPTPAPKPEVPAKLDAATGAQVPSTPTQTLPKTGEETSLLSLVGAILFSSFSIFLAKSKKREED